jgi:hypothetical protein
MELGQSPQIELSGYVFTAAITNADIWRKCLSHPEQRHSAALLPMWGNPNVESCCWRLPSKIFRYEPQLADKWEEIDLNTVSPYRLGRSLFNRISGLLGPYIDTGTMSGLMPASSTQDDVRGGIQNRFGWRQR